MAAINSIADRLKSPPRNTQGKDWKTFLLKNRWYPKRLLVAHFNIRPYDLDNWKRSHPEVTQALADPRYNFHFAETSNDVRDSLRKAWCFLFEQVLEIDFSGDLAPREIIKLQGIAKSDWGLLCDRRIFEKMDGYDEWIAEGYTQIAFVVFKIYPGEQWARATGISPAMFSQTRKLLTRAELVGILEGIYLQFLADLPGNPSDKEVSEAKEIFYIRARESSFITNSMLRPYGFTEHMTQDGVKDIILALRHKFAVELGLEAGVKDGWSASKFRKMHTSANLNKCRYCSRTPVDLHHLLSREEYSELIYDAENVVPLCTLVHSAITRNKISHDSAEKLRNAVSAWIAAKRSRKLDVFNEVMHELHKELY
jgi:hypothetical protein